MRQRGRKSPLKSGDNLVAFPVDDGTPHLQPPKILSAAERRLFLELVSSCDHRHFRSSDLPLLVAYCQATALSQKAIGKAGSDKDALGTWERSVKLMAVLATRLRISPQSRFDRKTVGSRELPRGPKPWAQKD